ncbi:MAG TPA: hypothetical protein VI756_19080 [Blastocatellia bacterium]
MKLWLISCLSVLLFSAVAFGDVPGHHPVRKPRQPGRQMVIQVDPEATSATLKIPRAMLKQFLAESGAIDSGEPDRAEDHAGTSVRTIIAGIFLSLAAIAGGLSFWRLRANKASRPDNGSVSHAASIIGAAIFVATASTVALVMTARADVRVPPSRPTPLTLALPDGGPVSGLVTVLIVPDGDQIVLSVPGTKPASDE